MADGVLANGQLSQMVTADDLEGLFSDLVK
jgi:hypothetical protein